MSGDDVARLEKFAKSSKLMGSLLVVFISAEIIIDSTLSWYVYNTTLGFLMFFMTIAMWFTMIFLTVDLVGYFHNRRKMSLIGPGAPHDTGMDSGREFMP